MLSELESLKIKAKQLQKAKRQAGQKLPLKEAYLLVARSAGYSSWQEMRQDVVESQGFLGAGSSAFWKTWYANYAEAREHWSTHGGYLIPYRKQYFVTDWHYVESLGLSDGDADLKKIGSNWAEPADRTAWEKLKLRIQKGSAKEK